MKILLAIDDSKFSDAALQMVISQNRPDGSQVRLIHVAEPITFLFPPEMAAEYAPAPQLDSLRKEHLRKAQEFLAGAVKKLRDAGFTADTALYEGDVRSEIIDIATEWHADLIVLGSHGRKGLDRFLIGSVSEYVARHAPCSVEIVRLPAKR
jgi:nucleotide-binding universal stress UspA family protein